MNMDKKYRISILSENRTVEARGGSSLLSALANGGVFLRADCGGNGRCAKCTVKIMGDFRPGGNPSAGKSSGGNRTCLACKETVDGDLAVEIPESAFLNPDVVRKPEISGTLKSRIENTFNGENRFSGLCLAIDLGTTTIAVYLCDIEKRRVVGSISLKNPQALFGDDVMSRISAVSQSPLVLKRLQSMVAKAIDWGVEKLVGRLKGIDSKNIGFATAVGASTMIHLFLGRDPSALGVYPFEPLFVEGQETTAGKLGLSFNSRAEIRTLPLVSGFLGADIVAAAMAVDLERAPVGTVLADVGTNGELMGVGKDGLVAASCATGPALEGATIKNGMQGVSGAVYRVSIDGGSGECLCEVKGNSKPTGICGSGLISVVAELYRARILLPDGRLDRESRFDRLRFDSRNLPEWVLVPKEESGSGNDIVVAQKDIRNVQLAKGAFRAGIDTICEKIGVERPTRLLVAGAFGNYIDKRDAIAIGMFPDMPEPDIENVGNAAGEGAILSLFDSRCFARADTIARKALVLNLASHPRFQDRFVDSMAFPSPASFHDKTA